MKMDFEWHVYEILCESSHLIYSETTLPFEDIINAFDLRPFQGDSNLLRYDLVFNMNDI